jgi:hypothetical protein
LKAIHPAFENASILKVKPYTWKPTNIGDRLISRVIILIIGAVDGQETVIADHDKNWDYRRIIWKEDGFKKRYYVSKKDNTKLKMNRQLMEPQYAGDVWAELRPGTKAYDAVKRDVFKEK